uniref:Ig-like domain-containing protein n=1 Tax=Sinocyclocheilus grahami TaxID=75366 RepID=A0A672KE28_SINGR
MFFDTDGVSVMEGDSLTLNTGDQMKQEGNIEWYFNNTHIARICGDPCFSCTDVQCDKDTKRFRDRLKLDRKTGSLTIRDIRTTDSGFYDLLIFRRRRSSRTKVFLLAVHGESYKSHFYIHNMKVAFISRVISCCVTCFLFFPPLSKKRKSVKEGESVTLDTRIIKNQNNSITWYFNDTLIAEITGDQSKIYRLKLDQTGSLTITNTRTTDSGLYQLTLTSGETKDKRFNVTVSVHNTIADEIQDNIT